MSPFLSRNFGKGTAEGKAPSREARNIRLGAWKLRLHVNQGSFLLPLNRNKEKENIYFILQCRDVYKLRKSVFSKVSLMQLRIKRSLKKR